MLKTFNCYSEVDQDGIDKTSETRSRTRSLPPGRSSTGSPNRLDNFTKSSTDLATELVKYLKYTEQCMNIPVEVHKIGHLIGKRGKNIKRIEGKCQVTVNIVKKHDEASGYVTVVVFGLPESCDEAFVEICKSLTRINEKVLYPILKIQENFVKFVERTIPVEMCKIGRLIGKHGKNVKLIEEKYKVIISIKKKNQEITGYVSVVVFGLPEFCDNAFVEICKSLMRIELEFLIPQKYVGKAIGFRGQNTKAVGKEFAVVITALNEYNDYEALIRIKGHSDSCQAAKEKIIEIIDSNIEKKPSWRLYP